MVGRHPGMEVVGEVGEPCPGRKVVVVEAAGEEPCLAAAAAVVVVEVVVVVAQVSSLVLQVAAAAVEEEEVGEAQTKMVPRFCSDSGMEAAEEVAVAALGMGHLAADGFPASPGLSVWPYPLWPAVHPLPDDHHSIWRTPASG